MGRRKLPGTRRAITHKGTIFAEPVVVACPNCAHKIDISPNEVEIYITVGLYPDGSPGEIFVKLGRHGDTVKGLVGQWATVVSIALQHEVPLELLCSKGAYTRFEPSGMTTNSEIRIAKSIIDYICRWMLLTFTSKKLLPSEEQNLS